MLEKSGFPEFAQGDDEAQSLRFGCGAGCFRAAAGLREPGYRQPLLAAAGAGELWRTCGSNCLDASGVGGAAPLALGAALSACPELLHGFARPRGHPAGHLSGLADAWHPGGADRRRPVSGALGAAADRPLQRLCVLGATAAVDGCVLGPQAGSAGDRAAGGLARGPTHLAPSSPGAGGLGIFPRPGAF